MYDIISTDALTFVVSPRVLRHFSQILQRGFSLRIRIGCSLAELLVKQLGIEKKYVEERISTIFLDGRPVDNLQGARVHDRSTLSFSAAMPGLVGASMRRKGAYALLRNTIGYSEDQCATLQGEGWIEIRLFNLVINELGPLFLTRGVFVGADSLADLINSAKADFAAGCRSIFIGERPVSLETAMALLKEAAGLLQVFVIADQEVAS